MLVVLESTTYPGTTDEIVRPLLEERSGLQAGRDFALAFSPERVDPGNPDWGIRNTPKVVGGITPSCSEAAEIFYGKICDQVIKAASAREAEMVKMLENTYRHVNIALVNEMAIFSMSSGSTCGTPSAVRRRSRLGSKPSTRGRELEVTVSRSIRITCPTGCVRLATRSALWSWRRRLMAVCPATSSTGRFGCSTIRRRR